jgi:myo-inositol-1(or 4)-monophosphatase
MLNLETLCTQVCKSAREAGAFIRTEQKKIKAGQVETKSRNSLVTYVDKQSEAMLVKALGTLLPGSAFIAEEGTVSNADNKGPYSNYQWVIDPLDGTTNFIHGIPCFAVSIGLHRDQVPVLGVVYEVNMDECFYAWEGSPAYLNGSVIKVSATSKLEDSLLATGFPYYDHGQEEEYMLLFRQFMRSTRGLRRLGSAATDLAYVACGRFEAFYEYSLQPWDVSAGAFLVQQAGGKVCDFQGGKDFIFGKSIVACNDGVFTELMHHVNHYF